MGHVYKLVCRPTFTNYAASDASCGNPKNNIPCGTWHLNVGQKIEVRNSISTKVKLKIIRKQLSCFVWQTWELRAFAVCLQFIVLPWATLAERYEIELMILQSSFQSLQIQRHCSRRLNWKFGMHGYHIYKCDQYMFKSYYLSPALASTRVEQRMIAP